MKLQGGIPAHRNGYLIEWVRRKDEKNVAVRFVPLKLSWLHLVSH
jgi:hypothetical protein